MQETLNLKVDSLKELKKGLYEVTINNKAYKLVTDTILKFRLVKGKEVASLDEVLNYNQKVIYLDKIRNYALKYPKSSFNLAQSLKEKYSDLDINFIIDILKQEGIVSDFAYAKQKALSLSNKGYGISYITNYLRFKDHISQDIINSLNIENNEHKLEELVEKLKKKDPSDQNKLIKALLRKGYKYDDFKALL